MRKRIRKFRRRLEAKYLKPYGFTLLEVLAVVVIMGIIASIAVPSVFATIEKTRADVCHLNTSDIEKRYRYHLVFEDKEHSDEVFYQYLLQYGGDLCPTDGVISYKDGKVNCSVHPKDEDQHDGKDENNEVPYL